VYLAYYVACKCIFSIFLFFRVCKIQFTSMRTDVDGAFFYKILDITVSPRDYKYKYSLD